MPVHIAKIAVKPTVASLLNPDYLYLYREGVSELQLIATNSNTSEIYATPVMADHLPAWEVVDTITFNLTKSTHRLIYNFNISGAGEVSLKDSPDIGNSVTIISSNKYSYKVTRVPGILINGINDDLIVDDFSRPLILVYVGSLVGWAFG